MVVYAFQISQPSFHGIIRIRLQAVDDIHIRRCRPDRYDLDDTFAVGIRGIVNTAKRVTFRDKFGSRPSIGRYEILECYPVLTVLCRLPGCRYRLML